VRHESHNAGETFINLGRRAAVCKFVSKITGVTEENGGKSQQKIIQSAAAWLISAAEKSQDFLWPIKARSRNRKTKAALKSYCSAIASHTNAFLAPISRLKLQLI